VELSAEHTKSAGAEPQPVKPLPFLVKLTALLLIVYGFIGFGYYLFTLIYSLSNPHFLDTLKFNGFEGNMLFIPLSVEVVVHIAVMMSGFFLLYKKKSGLYFYYFAVLFSLFFFVVFTAYLNYTEIAIGSLMFFVLWGYRSRLE